MKHSNKTVSLAITAAVGILTLGLASTTANATPPNGTLTSTFQVTATVNATCSISASALGFGTYTGAQTDATSTLSVTCTNTTPYTIDLDAGKTTGATVTTRQMKGPGTDTLSYALFSDPNRTTNWGNTAGTDVTGAGSGSTQSITVYGRLASGPLVQPGAYTDTITATLTY